jgi:hypothetical protein
MARENHRVEIPAEVAALVLFQSDRTCCVCRERGKPVQLHHIDENSANSIADNLAVLCFDCHHLTQIRGGFDRKLDAAQVKLYKESWNEAVAARRAAASGQNEIAAPNQAQFLRYLQIREESEEHRYSFEADFPLVGSAKPGTDRETNLLIESFVSRKYQRFRADAIARSREKAEQAVGGFSATAWDSLGIYYKVSMFTPRLLSLEFQFSSYFAGAAHPNTHTATMNFALCPARQLEICDLFLPNSDYLEVLSKACIEDLLKQQIQRWHDPAARAEEIKTHGDNWINQGAGPRVGNFECLSLTPYGIVIHFDPYRVGSYGEGKYEVFLSERFVRPILNDEIARLLDWR